MINATSAVAELAFRLIQDTIKFVMKRYSLEHVKFHVIAEGQDKICFDSNSSNLAALEERVEGLEGGREGIPKLDEDFEKAVKAFQTKCLGDSRKVIKISFIKNHH